MDGRGSQGADLWTGILQGAAIVAPVLAVLALVLFLTRDEDSPSAAATPGVVVTSDGSGAPAGDRAPRSVAAPAPEPTVEAEAEVEPEPGARTAIVQVRPDERVKVFDGRDGELIAGVGDETEFGSPTVFSVQRRDQGWIGVSTALTANGDLGWIRTDPRRLRGAVVEHSVAVDLSERTVEVFEGRRILRRWPATVGAPGSETPTGRFAVTDTFRGDLNPAYGCCAVALSATQPNLPAGWVGGDRIAFHGTDGPIGVAASTGCVRIADRHVATLLEIVPLGTPVTIRN